MLSNFGALLNMKDFKVVSSSNVYFRCPEYTIYLGNEKNESKSLQVGVWIKLVIGVIVGFVNGFWGGGGGMICVPLLMKLFDDPKKAHATTLLVMLPLSIASIIVYAFNGVIEWLNVLKIGAGFVLGGMIGAIVLKAVNSVWLEFIFAAIIIWSGIRMCI